MEINDKEVLLPSFSCSVVRDAVCLAGATPVFIDVNPETLEMNLKDTEKHISEKTKAIIIIHYYGKPCSNMDKILKSAKEKNILVIEDCAHSLGAQYNGMKVGTFGDISIFSLTKNMLNFQGGVLATNNRRLYENAMDILKNEGQRTLFQSFCDFYMMLINGWKLTTDKLVRDRMHRAKFEFWLIKFPNFLVSFPLILESLIKKFIKTKQDCIGFYQVNVNNRGHLKDMKVCLNLKMNPLIASVGRIQIKKLDLLNMRRIKICSHISSATNNYYLKNIDKSNIKNVYSMIPLNFSGGNLNEIVKKCRIEGLSLRQIWPAYQDWWNEQDSSNIRKIRDSLLMWDVNPMITDEEITHMINVINNEILAIESKN